MSLGYAEKLSWREDLGGQLGAKERFDSPVGLARKVDELADLVRESRRVIVFTGAGISTSCGIPDFRGPDGVWTAYAAGRPSAAQGDGAMLTSLPLDLLQRILARCDASDRFLLRQVCRSFRAAVAPLVQRAAADWRAPTDLALSFLRLSSLDLGLGRSASTQASLAQALQQLPELRELLRVDLSFHAIPGQTLQRLTRLSLTGVGAEGELSSLAGSCTSLQRLEFAFGAQVAVADLLSAVAQLAATLTHLDLDATYNSESLSDESLQALNTGRLRRLQLPAALLPTNACQQLAAFTSLTSLELRCLSSLQGQGLPRLNALTRLTSLGLRYSEVSKAVVAQLTALTGLAALDVSAQAGSPPHGLSAALARFPGLTELDVSQCVCGNISGALSGLAQLTRLVAKRCDLVQQPLPRLPSLRVLELQGSVRNDSQLRHLSGLCGLTRLSLAHNFEQLPLAQVGVKWLAALPALQHLCLAGWRISREALEQLAHLRVLRALDLQRGALPHQCDLSPLESLRLERLRPPLAQRHSALARPALKVAVLKGSRWDDEQWGALCA